VISIDCTDKTGSYADKKAVKIGEKTQWEVGLEMDHDNGGKHSG